MTLSDLLTTNSVFTSTVWADFVTYIRDLIDLDPLSDPQPSTYPINTIDENLYMHYGDLEVVPSLYTIVDGVETVNTAKLIRSVNAVIGQNLQYWKRLADSLLAEFNPLYNVDANETTTTEYGQHITTDAKGQKQRTDVHGAQSETAAYGKKQTANSARSDYTIDGAHDTEHSETTMDNTASYIPRTKDENSQHRTDIQKGAETVTEDPRTDTVSSLQYTDTSTDAASTDIVTSKTHTDTVTIRRYGNIGVTMSTQLLRDFQLFARESDLVGIIAGELAKELTFGVWY